MCFSCLCGNLTQYLSLSYGTFHTFTPVISYIILYYCFIAIRHVFCLDTIHTLRENFHAESGDGYGARCDNICNQLKIRELPLLVILRLQSDISCSCSIKPAIATWHRCLTLMGSFLVHFPCSEVLCSCDTCSFKKLKEVESTLPPGLPMPYISSWTNSQFSQTSLQAATPLAPRTGYEPPYWHRPCYFGWHYATRGLLRGLLAITSLNRPSWSAILDFTVISKIKVRAEHKLMDN